MRRTRHRVCVLVSALMFAFAIAACSSGSQRQVVSPTTSTVAKPSTTVAPPPTSVGPTTVVPTTAPAAAVPAGFAPASVTFVSERTGWLLGAAPCGSSTCAALVQTTDGGSTWSRLPVAPPGPPANSRPLQRRVRFANLHDGWIFGPDLWETHDGGAHWTAVALPDVPSGSEVESLEAGVGRVHAAVAVMSDAPGVRIFTSAVDHDGWTASPVTVPVGAGPIPGGQIVLHADAGWFIQIDRTVVGGARLVNGAWAGWQPPCADVVGPASIAASTATDVVALCNEGQWSTPLGDHLHVSSDGGSSFRRIRATAPGSYPITSPVPNEVVTGTADSNAVPRLVATFDLGAHWTAVFTGTPGTGFVDLGFTTTQRGIVIEAKDDGTLGRLLQSTDGGHSWHAVEVASKS